MTNSPSPIATVRSYLLDLQQRITTAFAGVDGGAFLQDAWTKDPGEPLQGDGITMILEGGAVLERGGCGFSHYRAARRHPPPVPPTAPRGRGAA